MRLGLLVGDETPDKKPSSVSARDPRVRYQATVEQVVERKKNTRSLFLRLHAGGRLPFKPGQFISLELPIGDPEPLIRPYSLASAPEAGDLLEICVDLVPGGLGSTYLFGVGPGSVVRFTGPYGSFTVEEPPAAETVFIGSGTAIAPIRPMVRRVIDRGGSYPVQILHAARSESELIYRDDFEAWSRAHRRVYWQPVFASAAMAENARLEQIVAERYVSADTDRGRYFWVCGVGEIVGRLRDMLRSAGYNRRAVRCEQW